MTSGLSSGGDYILATRGTHAPAQVELDRKDYSNRKAWTCGREGDGGIFGFLVVCFLLASSSLLCVGVGGDGIRDRRRGLGTRAAFSLSPFLSLLTLRTSI